ncbi:MAG: KEOPS complex subunit Pcc1 [Methanosarcinaceae archaeon]
MKIHGTIEFNSPDAPEIARSVSSALEPDNLSSMRTDVCNDVAIVHFSTGKITSLIATVDDFLMNAKIAEDVEKQLG